MKSLTAIIAPPLLCAGVLLGITVEKFGHVRPRDADAYHARVKAAIEQMDLAIVDDGGGVWIGEEITPTRAAVQLLRPNIILSRRYTDDRGRSGSPQPQRQCSVLIVHCKDSRDMVGHYPENCYVNIGETLLQKRDREWQVGGVPIIGTEYMFDQFDRSAGVRRRRRCVYNFLVVPKGDGMVIVRDIKGLNEAAEDYQKRYFGAAQFQFVMSDELSRNQRDQIFETLLGSNPEVFEALSSVEVR